MRIKSDCGMTYRHILVPTDGSQRSRKAIKAAARLARCLGARISAVYVIAEGVPTFFSGKKLYGSGVLGAEYRKLANAEAQRALLQAEREAASAGVPCAAIQRLARDPWRAILAAARVRRCDLIVMGTHGRGAVASALLGSQTLKVLAHSRKPVLVCR